MGTYLAGAGMASALACVLTLAPAAPRAAAAPLADYVLACDNGRDYPLRATAVSVTGDLVAGYLQLGRHHGAHVRLVPMGAGYRYAGLGFWVDGWRDEAVLHLGKHKAVNCSVHPAAGG